jgi:hypothetical protein
VQAGPLPRPHAPAAPVALPLLPRSPASLAGRCSCQAAAPAPAACCRRAGRRRQ